MLLLPFRFDFVFGLVCSLIDHVQTTKVGTAGTANSNQPLGSLLPQNGVLRHVQNREAALQVNGWTETSYRKLCEMTDLL
jgi:hypothetical protein